MTARTLLDRIREIRSSIAYRNEKIEDLEELACNTTSQLTGMPRGGGADHSPMATAICEKIDLEREIAELTEERNRLIAKLDLIGDEDLERLLMLRYVRGLKWEQIMTKMGYSETQIHRLHRKALTILDEKMAVNGS